MDQQEQLAAIELSIDQAKLMIGKSDALLRLEANKDFQRIVLHGYFEEEASRSVLLRADPGIQGENEQKQINDIITSIGGFHYYLNTIHQLASSARAAINANEEAREEILGEQLGVDEV